MAISTIANTAPFSTWHASHNQLVTKVLSIDSTKMSNGVFTPGGSALGKITGVFGKWKAPYLTSNTAASGATYDIKPSGQSLAGIVGTANKWQVPYLTSNTNSSASLSAVTPSGLSLMRVAGAVGWQAPYLTSNVSPLLSPVRPGGLALLSLVGVNGQIPIFTGNTSTSISTVAYTAPTATGAAIEALNNPSGKWNVPYLTTTGSAALIAVRPGGIALLGATGTAGRIPYFTSNSAISTLPFTPSGQSLATVLGASGQWLIPYLTSNTSAAASTVALRPGGIGLLGLIGLPGRIPYFTSNTASGVSVASLTPCGMALASTIGVAAKWTVPYFVSNTSAPASLASVRPGGLALMGLPGGAADTMPYFTANTSSGASTTTITSFARTLLDDTSASAAAATIGAVKTVGGQNLTGGFTTTSYNIGTVTSGTITPNPAVGNIQHYINNGPHTLAPPASPCTMIIEVTNSTAGAITTSSFSIVSGDTYSTTGTKKHIFFITKTNNFSQLHVQYVTGS